MTVPTDATVRSGGHGVLPHALVNRGLVAYVGDDPTGRPTRRPEAVRALAPEGLDGALLARVRELHDEADDVDVPPVRAVGRSVLPAFAAVVRRRHPWLDDAAVDALCRGSRHRREYE